MTDKKKQRYSVTNTMNPRERRAKAREKIDAELRNRMSKSRKLRDDIRLMEKVVKEDNPPPNTGRVVEQERVDSMAPALREAAEQTVIFKPNEGPQTDFLAASETDVLYGGQAGGGKSYSLIVDPLRFAHRPKHRAIILRKTLKELRELIDNTRELYPKAFPGVKYRESDKVWNFPSGAKVEFGYLERDSDVYQYQGQQFSWIGFDEITHLPTEAPWHYLASRLRTADPEITCYMRCTANPGGVGHAWVKKRYIDPCPPNEAFIYGRTKTGEVLTRKFIPARLSDNPYLYADGRYEAVLETLPEVERRRLLHGDWDVNEASAFPEFNRELHVLQPFDIPHWWNRVKAIDYGYSAPSCCLWGAVDPTDGTIIIYRELYQKGLVASALAEAITNLEVGEQRNIPGVLDGAAWNRTGADGPTVGETLCRAPYRHKLRRADKNRVAGRVQVHTKLMQNSETGRPGLQIFSTCTNLIREITTIPNAKNNPEDVDTNADDHAYDALRYLVMSRPRAASTDDLLFRVKRETSYTASDKTFGY